MEVCLSFLGVATIQRDFHVFEVRVAQPPACNLHPMQEGAPSYKLGSYPHHLTIDLFHNSNPLPGLVIQLSHHR